MWSASSMQSPASAGPRSNVDDIRAQQQLADRRQLGWPSHCHPTNSTLTSETVVPRTAISSAAVVEKTRLGSSLWVVLRNDSGRSLDLSGHADDLPLAVK